jgi:hypothetical protein
MTGRPIRTAWRFAVCRPSAGRLSEWDGQPAAGSCTANTDVPGAGHAGVRRAGACPAGRGPGPAWGA